MHHNVSMGNSCMAWSCAILLGHQGISVSCVSCCKIDQPMLQAVEGRGLAFATLMRDLSTRVSSCNIPSVSVRSTGAGQPMGTPQAVTVSVLASMASNVAVNSAEQTSVVRCDADNADMRSLESAALLLTISRHSRRIVDQ